MPKMKTHSGAKKRFKITAKGKIKATQANKQHFMRRRTNTQIRDQRGTTILQCIGEVKRLKRLFLPNIQS